MLAHPPMPVDGTPPQLLALDKPVDETSTVPSCDSIATGLNSWGQPYKPVEGLTSSVPSTGSGRTDETNYLTAAYLRHVPNQVKMASSAYAASANSYKFHGK